jgi:hypothetical protein
MQAGFSLGSAVELQSSLAPLLFKWYVTVPCEVQSPQTDSGYSLTVKTLSLEIQD